MGKRKQVAPQKTSEEKRQVLSWNMVEGVVESHSMTVVSDNDPDIALSAETQQKIVAKSNLEYADNPCPGFFSEEMEFEFQENLKTCSFSVVLQSQPNFKAEEFHAKIGKFTIKLHLDEKQRSLLDNGLPSCPECWFYANEEVGRSMLYFELDENNRHLLQCQTSSRSGIATIFFFADFSIQIEALEALQIKQCQNVLTSYDTNTNIAEVVTYISSAAVTHLHYASEFVKPKRFSFSLQELMSEFYGISAPTYKGLVRRQKHDIEDLYESIKYKHQRRERNLLFNVQHPSLKPRLRPYQKDAVLWMLEREGFKYLDESAQQSDVEQGKTTDHLHQLYEVIHTLDGKILYYNPYNGCLVRDKPLSVAPLPGGILADEMGLGKTVEVLACMLSHPRTDLPPVEPLPVVEIIEEEPEPENAVENMTDTTFQLDDVFESLGLGGKTKSDNTESESKVSTHDILEISGKSDADSLADVEIKQTSVIDTLRTPIPLPEKDDVDFSGDCKPEVLSHTDTTQSCENNSEKIDSSKTMSTVQETTVPYSDHDYIHHQSNQGIDDTVDMIEMISSSTDPNVATTSQAPDAFIMSPVCSGLGMANQCAQPGKKKRKKGKKKKVPTATLR